LIVKVAVVGGGLGGLAAARALVAAGVDAHVFEASARPGGVLATTRQDGFVREHAATAFVGGPPHGALALCNELGVRVEKAAKAAKRRWIFVDGALRELPRDPIAFARSDLLTWRGKLDLLREPLRPARRGGDDESVHAFAARRLGAEAARALVAPMVTGVFAADAREISLAAGFPRLAALDAAGGLVRGGIRAMLARRRDEPRTPRGLYAPAGGLQSLVDALVAALGDRVHVGAPVRAIAPAAGGVAMDGARWDGVVLALAAEDAAPLVAGGVPELASRLGELHRAPAAIVYLGYAASAVPRARDGFGFLVAHGEDVRVLGCVFESTVWLDRARPGHALLRCIYGGGRDPQAAAQSERELVAQARRDLEAVLGVTAEPVHASVVVHARGIAQYRVGHRERVRAAEASARMHRIALAGADYRGPAVNDLCADASVVAEEVARWR
jgi:oxygen-dependent protoporphyrinogen oxidase